jgi:RNA polymerase-binding transcription factor DksA
LIDLNEHLGDAQNRLQCAAKILNITGPVHRLAELIIQVKQNVELFRKLLVLKNRLAVLNEGVDLIQRDLNTTAQVDVITTLIMETNNQLNLLIKLSNKSSQLNIAKNMARIRGNDCNTITEHIKCAQQKYIDLLTSYGICPTCGSNVSPEKLKEVI